jgi:hypothetical protein
MSLGLSTIQQYQNFQHPALPGADLLAFSKMLYFPLIGVSVFQLFSVKNTFQKF